MDMSIWYLVGAILVFFMQAGFAMVESGLTRAKNAGNIIMKNLMDFCIGTVVFMLLGYGIMNSESYFFGLIGLPEYQLRHCRNHRIRRHGGAHQILQLLHLLRCDLRRGLSH